MNAPITPVAQLVDDLPDLDWVTDTITLRRLSQDFAWFSPVLKRELGAKRAEVAVRPRSEDEIRRVVAACAQRGIPLTLRGAGTGNYGQSTPLHGGVVVDLSAFNQLCWVRDGVGRAQAGIRLAEFDEQARPQGWELRWLPSTFRLATLGGLFGGGFGGAGSINYGPMAATGNVLGVRVMTVEPEPQILELRAPEALLLHHVYGTNGIVLEIEVALAPALPWTECIAVFDGFDAALEFASTLASAPGIVKKEVCFLAAPIPDHLTALAEHLPRGGHAVLMLVADWSEPGMHELLARFGGRITYRRTAEAVRASGRTLIEYTWNHTTLNALKVDRNLTYVQTGFDPARHVEQAKALERALGGEVMTHLEFLRTKEGAFNCSGLQLIRYTSDERLEQIMQVFRDHGVHVNNPHVYIVEDGKQGRINPAVVELKSRFDPQGLLNPGKLRSWTGRGAGASEAVPAAAQASAAAA